MDYFGIVKKAFHISWKHKFLWIFGILAGGATGFRGFNFSAPSYSFDNSQIQQWTNTQSPNINWANFWSSYGWLILTLVIVFALLAIIFFILNIISQAALVGSVDEIESDHQADFYSGWHIGWHQFWRVWGMGILFLLMILISLIILVIPVAVLVIGGQYIIATILGILLLMICIAFWILIGFIAPYSLRVVVLKKLSVFDSIRESLHLVRDHWVDVLVMYLLLAAIGIGIGLAIILALMLIVGILLVIGFGIWLASPVASVIYGLIFGLALGILMITFSGAYSSFYSSTITLTYLKLVNK